MGYLVIANLSDVIEETSTKRRNSEGGRFGFSRRMEGELLVVVKKWVTKEKGGLRERIGTEAGLLEHHSLSLSLSMSQCQCLNGKKPIFFFSTIDINLLTTPLL